MKKIVLIIYISLVASLLTYSQSIYVDNALKISSNDYGGTARFVGMGGAFGAIGGDFSSLSVNPAGLGIYRSSEFVFSPGMSYNSNASTYLGNSSDDNGYMANLNNIGYIASYNLENSDTRWVNFNFGVGFNRINDFNDNVRFEGVNNNSRMEKFLDYARQTTNPNELDAMYERLLWDSELLLFDSTYNEFYNEIDDAAYLWDGTKWVHNPNFLINQREIIRTEGSISEFNFSFGANYAHTLYVGANIGITRLRYKQYSSHYEHEYSGFDIPDVYGFDFIEKSVTSGTGFNIKFGAIYRPIEPLRIGLALHLPTFYNLSQDFYNEAKGYYDSYNSDLVSSPTIIYDYNLNTPLRFIGSFAFQIGKIGIIDVDYELVDYSAMKLNDDKNDPDGVEADNKYINNIFQKTHNIRAGAEFRYGSIYFRAGGRYSTSPYKDIAGAMNPDYEKMTISGGLGYRENNFFIDFAASQTTSSYNVMAYAWDYNDAVASIDNKFSKFILTFGFKF